MEPKTPRQWPLAAETIEWSRGPAWVDDDEIVMDSTRATTYWPLAEPSIGIELARVETPAHAVEFVSRFGLLRQPASLRGSPLTPLREPFVEFEAIATRLRSILSFERLVRRGADGDAQAIRDLRWMVTIPEDDLIPTFDENTGEPVTRRAGDLWTPEERLVDAEDRIILLHAAQTGVARPLTMGLADSQACVQDRAFVGDAGQPGKFRIGVVPRSLEVVCYLSVALALADRVPSAVCADPDCARPFFVTDKRQRFCSRACGNRVRFRRYMNKHGRGDNAEGE